ncbi:MAG: trigger factor [Thermodesulfobacteriota bacterium]
MKVAVEDLSQVKKKIRIDIPAEDVDKELNAAYKKLQSRVKVDGFRKGKAPIPVLERRYGRQVLDEVSTKLIEDSFPKAMLDKELSPISMPRIDANTVETGKPFIYDATIEVKPELSPEGYVGMAIKKDIEKVLEVTDEEMNEALERIREQRAEYVDVERDASDGDLLFVDFKGTVDGKEINDGSATDYPLKIGENSLLPGFEEALKGLKKGEMKEVKLTLPYDYREKALAGEEVVFNVTVKSVKEKVLHKLDDEFAKDLECEDFEELKSKVRERMIDEEKAAMKERLKGKVMEELIARNKFEPPQSLLTRYMKPVLERAIDNIKRGIGDPDDANLTDDALNTKYSKIAERQLRRDMILDSIAEKEGITVSSEEIDAKIEDVAKKSGETPEIVKKNIEKQNMVNLLKKSLLDEKVFEFILSKAV